MSKLMKQGAARSFVLIAAMLFSFFSNAQDGSLDAAFTVAGGNGLQGEVFAVVVQPDGKILAGGNFSTFNGISRRGVVRLNVDGSLDPTFAPVGTSFRGPNVLFEIKALALQPDGKILVGGYFTEYNGTPRNYVVRLNSDGSLDPSFVPAAAVNITVFAILVQPDGKIVLGGGFYASAATRYVVRLNADGTLDPGFSLTGTSITNGGGTSGTGVYDLALQPDGKIFIAGEFSHYNGIAVPRVARLNANGSLDPSFAPTGGGINGGNHLSEYYVQSIALQRDGKVIAVGAFTAYNYISRRSIVRLNTDGSLDQNFLHAGGFNGTATCVLLQPDGKILVGGGFGTYNSITRNRLARLNADGSLDAGFTLTGTGFNQQVNALALQADGKIVVAGNVSVYNGASIPRMVRLNNTVRTVAVDDLAVTTYFPGSSMSLSYTVYGVFNPGNVFTAQLSNASGSFANAVDIGSQAGTLSSSMPVTIPVNTPAGTGYRMRVVASNPALSGPDNAANITVTGPPSATISYPGSPYCGSNTMALVTLNGTNGGSFSSTPGLSVEPVTGMIDLANSDEGNYVVTYTAGAFVTTTQVGIRPQLSTTMANKSICAGSTVPAVVFTAVPGLHWSWTNSSPSVGLAASGTGDIPSFTALNAGSSPVSTFISIAATGGTECSFRKVGFQLTVKPTPSLPQPSNQTLCAGSATQSVSFVSSLAGSTVSWTNNNTSIGLVGFGTGNIPSFTTINNMNSLQTATIIATPVAGGCSGVARSFAIQVSPSAGTLSYGGAAYCQTGRAYPTRTGSAGVFSATPAGLDLDAATGQVNLGLSQPGVYTVTNSVNATGGCNSGSSASITINPQATVNPIPNQTWCNGILTSPIVFTGTGVSYSWTNDNSSIGLAPSGSGTQVPSFTTVNAGPGTQYATIRVTPVGNGSSTCTSKASSFRITVNYCGPVAQHGDTGGSEGTGRISTGMSISPNPSSGRINIQISGADGGSWQLQVLNKFGLPVGVSARMSGLQGSLDMGMLTPGVYILRAVNTRTGATLQKQVIRF
jgi:uncharacterized delta-60 repeat protein